MTSPSKTSDSPTASTANERIVQTIHKFINIKAVENPYLGRKAQTELETNQEADNDKSPHDNTSWSNWERININNEAFAKLRFDSPKNENIHNAMPPENKNHYFRSAVVTMHQSLVTREMLQRNISLGDKEDREVTMNILKKNPKYRSYEEVTFAQQALKSMAFFADLERELDECSFTSLFRKLCFDKFVPGQKIYGCGDIARRFYVILQGSVYVLFKNDGVIMQEIEYHRNQKGDESPFSIDKLQRILKSCSTEEERRKNIENYYRGLWIACTTNEGESFGEISLQKSEDKLRTATVVAREETWVGVLSMEEYNAIVAKIYEARYNEKMNFLEKIDAFSHWAPNYVSAFASQVEEIKVPRNKVILKEGEMQNYLYFIKSGEIELQKMINLPEDERREILQNLEDKEKNKGQGYRAKKQESLKLGRIGHGDYFGISPSLEKKPSEFTATVSSAEAVLVMISIYKFSKFVRDKITLGKIKDHLSRREAWHKEMMSNYINVNNIFSTKTCNDQPAQSELTPIPLVKTFSAHGGIRKRVESAFRITSKSHNQSRESSVDSSKETNRSQGKVKPIESARLQTANSTGDSHKLFNSVMNAKTSKFGIAYERHQARLKKFMEEKEAKEKKLLEEDVDIFFKKQSSKHSGVQDITNNDDFIKESLPDASRNTQIAMAWLASPCLNGGGNRSSLRITTEEHSKTNIIQSLTPGIKIASMPIKTQLLKSPQMNRKLSVCTRHSEVTNSLKVRKSFNCGMTEPNTYRTEDSAQSDKPVIINNRPVKRNSAYLPGEILMTSHPRALSTFYRKN